MASKKLVYVLLLEMELFILKLDYRMIVILHLILLFQNFINLQRLVIKLCSERKAIRLALIRLIQLEFV